MAESLSQINKDIHSRLDSFSTSYQTIKPSIPLLLESYHMNKSSSSVSESSSKGSSKKDNKSKRNISTTQDTSVKAPIQRLNELLNKN